MSSPNTPQSSDEEAVEQFIRGRKSIVHCDLLNRGTLLTKMPEQMDKGRVVADGPKDEVLSKLAAGRIGAAAA